jgi:pseudouridine-5'-phosphate glycosidase
MRNYLAADHAESAVRTSNTTAVALRIVTTLTNRGMPFPPTTAMAATVHNAARAPTPTETGEW